MDSGGSWNRKTAIGWWGTTGDGRDSRVRYRGMWMMGSPLWCSNSDTCDPHLIADEVAAVYLAKAAVAEWPRH
jgi:hypothetical protein